jgi:plasmid stabilization system protein ParE
MTNGYNIFWTDHALNELDQTIKYLEESWTNQDVVNFVAKLEDTLALLSKSPELFPKSDIKKGIFRVIIAKHNTLYFRLRGENLEIVSFFSHRQSPRKRKLK